MALPTSPRAWLDAVSWHVRGLFASEANRRIGFRAREMWQPAEIEARRGLARDVATEVAPELRVERQAGHLVLPTAALPSLDEVTTIGRGIIREASLAVGESNQDKKFSRYRLATRDERIALLRVGLDRRVLAMVASYLGVIPVISEADFFCSFPVAGPFTKSQLWHCDDDAGDVFKLFIYCDDVAPADGPFELIEPTTSRRVRKAIGYRYAGRRYRVSDAVMERHVPSDQITQIMGRSGTAFVVDTVRCFHRGSRIVEQGHRRVAAMICYCPPNGRTVPRRLAKASAPLVELASSFTNEVERATLGVPLAKKWV